MFLRAVDNLLKHLIWRTIEMKNLFLSPLVGCCCFPPPTFDPFLESTMKSANTLASSRCCSLCFFTFKLVLFEYSDKILYLSEMHFSPNCQKVITC